MALATALPETESPPTVTLSPAKVRQWCARLADITVALNRMDRRFVDPVADMCGRMTAVGSVRADRVDIERQEPLMWQAQFMITAHKAVERCGNGTATDVLRQVADEIGVAVGQGVAR